MPLQRSTTAVGRLAVADTRFQGYVDLERQARNDAERAMKVCIGLYVQTLRCNRLPSRDILFVPDGDFTTSDIDEVIRNVRTFAFLRIFIHHNMVEEKTNIQTYTYSNFYF